MRHLPAEDVASTSPELLPSSASRDLRESRLQLCLLSPSLLHFLSSAHAATGFSLGGSVVTNPDRVVAIMLGVRDDQITSEHRAGLGSFSHWIHLEARDHDLEFVQTVLYFSTQILNRRTAGPDGHEGDDDRGGRPTSWRRARRARSSGRGFCAAAEARAGNGTFHIHPKKVTEVGTQKKTGIYFENIN